MSCLSFDLRYVQTHESLCKVVLTHVVHMVIPGSGARTSCSWRTCRMGTKSPRIFKVVFYMDGISIVVWSSTYQVLADELMSMLQYDCRCACLQELQMHEWTSFAFENEGASVGSKKACVCIRVVLGGHGCLKMSNYTPIADLALLLTVIVKHALVNRRERPMMPWTISRTPTTPSTSASPTSESMVSTSGFTNV